MLINQVDPLASDFVRDICAEYGHDEDAKSLFLVVEYTRLFASKALVSPYLFRLYVKRAYAGYLLGTHLEEDDFEVIDITIRSHYSADNLRKEVAALTEEIARIEGQIVSMSATIGQMTNVIPTVSPAGRFPASSPSLIGGPDAPRWYRS